MIGCEAERTRAAFCIRRATSQMIRSTRSTSRASAL